MSFYAKETIRVMSAKNGAVTVHAFDTKVLRDLFVERRRNHIDKLDNTSTERKAISEAEATVLIEKLGRSAVIKHRFEEHA